VAWEGFLIYFRGYSGYFTYFYHAGSLGYYGILFVL
jgi:hypothetical protein